MRAWMPNFSVKKVLMYPVRVEALPRFFSYLLRPVRCQQVAGCASRVVWKHNNTYAAMGWGGVFCNCKVPTYFFLLSNISPMN